MDISGDLVGQVSSTGKGSHVTAVLDHEIGKLNGYWTMHSLTTACFSGLLKLLEV